MPLTEAEEIEYLALLEAEEQARLWEPHPENLRQGQAYELADIVDEMFYGGAGGGGKTDLALGLAITKHKRSLILRREASDLDGIISRSQEIIGDQGRFNASPSTLTWRNLPNGGTIRFGGCKNEKDKVGYAGRPRDFIAFDEGPQFYESIVVFISAWLRSEDPRQHCFVLLTGNPPTGPDGYWIIARYAAWLDVTHPNPAEPGEIRWYARIDGKEVEVSSGEPFDHAGEVIYPKSRTFVPARVDDNPYLRDSGYKATLQALPEPLRSQMLYGDFSVGHDDDTGQVIPTEWVRMAQKRWQEMEKPNVPCDALGVDIARGGKDKTVIAPRYGTWFDNLIKRAGTYTPDGFVVAQLVTEAHRDNARINIDVISVGSSPYDILKSNKALDVHPINFAEKSTGTDRSGKLRFANKRAEFYWRFREALDPELGEDIALPPDPEILADLCAARWTVRTNGILIESKDDIKKRIGRSPDCGDGIVLAYGNSGHHAPVGYSSLGAAREA